MRVQIFIASVVGVLGCAGIARSEPLDEPAFALCKNDKAAPHERLSACDKVLRQKAIDVHARALAVYSRGNVQRDAGNTPAAMRDFSAALQLTPSLWWALANRGQLYLARGDYAHALADFNAGLKIAPREPVLLINRAIVYSAQHKDDQALADYNLLLAANPEEMHGLIGRAGIYVRRGQTAKALAEYDHFIRLHPNSVTGYVGRGAAYAGDEKWELAIAEYERAIAIAPSDGFAYAQRGNVLSRQGRNVEALRDYTRAAKLDPRYGPAALRQAGWEALSRQDYDVVIESYTAAASIDPGKVRDFYLIALAHEGLDQVRHAVEALNKGLALAPRDVESLTKRAELLTIIGATGKAQTDFDKLVAIDPRDPAAAAGACETRLWQNADLHRAKTLCDAAIDYDATGLRGANLYFVRGMLSFKMNDVGSAFQDFDAAVKGAPYLSAFKYARAVAEARLGREAEASADFKAAAGYEYLGEVFESAGLAPGGPRSPVSIALAEGRAALALKENQKAINIFDAAIAAESADTAALRFGRAIALLRMHRGADAKFDLQASRAMAPKIEIFFSRAGAAPVFD